MGRRGQGAVDAPRAAKDATIRRVSALQGRTVVLGVTGSIAAYKAVEVARLLRKAGAKVVPVLTRSAERFVGAVTFSGITGRAVHTDMWDPGVSGELHVMLADEADAVLVVPATADFLSRLSQGRADDLLSAVVLSARGPVLVAPAMHPRMWAHPATRRNVRALALDGRVELVGPVVGEVASGDVGEGRMAEPGDVVSALARALGPRDLDGRHVVVTAGPTHEPIDPVRFLGNRSSGKMGFAIASEAARRGARVTLIAGPTAEPSPANVTRVDVTTAFEMGRALGDLLGPEALGADLLVMAAAVADFRPADPKTEKIKKAAGEGAPDLALVRNPDLLASIGATRAAGGAALVGFALETGPDDAVLAYARKKLHEKRVDLVVANRADEALGGESSRVAFVSEAGASWLPQGEKTHLARAIVDAAKVAIEARR